MKNKMYKNQDVNTFYIILLIERMTMNLTKIFNITTHKEAGKENIRGNIYNYYKKKSIDKSKNDQAKYCSI